MSFLINVQSLLSSYNQGNVEDTALRFCEETSAHLFIKTSHKYHGYLRSCFQMLSCRSQPKLKEQISVSRLSSSSSPDNLRLITSTGTGNLLSHVPSVWVADPGEL